MGEADGKVQEGEWEAIVSGARGWGTDESGCSRGPSMAEMSKPENSSCASSWRKMPMKATAMAALALESRSPAGSAKHHR
jgi:hypothetical protein